MGEWLRNNPKNKFLFLFLLKGIIIYVLWVLVYDNWLIESNFIDYSLINHLIHTNKFLLELFGYDVFYNAKTIGIDGSHGVYIGAPCNGMSLFALFFGFVIAFKGKMKYKFPFILIGIIIIHLLNVLRIFSLTLLAKYSPELLDFNHKYTFTISIYIFIFCMWMVWVRKYANR